MSLGEPTIPVYCDSGNDYRVCQNEIQVDMHMDYANYDYHNLKEDVEQAGWHWVSEAEQYCVDCAVERGLVEQVKPSNPARWQDLKIGDKILTVETRKMMYRVRSSVDAEDVLFGIPSVTRIELEELNYPFENVAIEGTHEQITEELGEWEKVE